MEAAVLLGVLGLGTLFANRRARAAGERDGDGEAGEETPGHGGAPRMPGDETLSLEDIHNMELGRAQQLARAAAYPPDTSRPGPHVVNVDAGRFFGGSVYSELTETDMPYEDFRPNGMEPHYGATVKQPALGASRRHEDRLEGHGGGADLFAKKQEVEPFFSPLMGATHTAGTPALSDVMHAAAEPRAVSETPMKGEVPFQQALVGPGLDSPYSSQPDPNGMDFRVLPKSVDELRTANRVKTSYPGRVIPGGAPEQRGMLPTLQKNRPDTAFETAERGLVATAGAYDAPTARPEFAPSEERETSAYFPGGNGAFQAQSRFAQQSVAHSHETRAPPPRNAALPGSGTTSRDPFSTRYESSDPLVHAPYTAPAGARAGAPSDAAMRPQHLRHGGREETADSARATANMSLQAPGRGHVFDTRDAPRATTRETTASRDWLGLPYGEGRTYALVGDEGAHERQTIRQHQRATPVTHGNPNMGPTRAARQEVAAPRARALGGTWQEAHAGAPSAAGQAAGAYATANPSVSKANIQPGFSVTPPGASGATQDLSFAANERPPSVVAQPLALGPAASANPAGMSYGQLLNETSNEVRDSLNMARLPNTGGANAGSSVAQETAYLPQKAERNASRLAAPDMQFSYAPAPPASREQPPVAGDTRLDPAMLSYIATNPFVIGPAGAGGAMQQRPVAFADPSRMPAPPSAARQ